MVRIERVQNPHLWTKYCLRRHEVELAAGSPHINEQFLFHGCRKDIMAVIANEGFDIRVAGMQGSLGAGTYFAGTGSKDPCWQSHVMRFPLQAAWTLWHRRSLASIVFGKDNMCHMLYWPGYC